jgi:hypothetical protein
VTILMIALAALAAASCGGGKSDEGEQQDVETLLDRAFRQSLKSADVKIDARLEIDGLQGFDRPVSIKASGPYIGSKDTLPKLNIDLNISSGGGQAIQSGFISTGDRAFIKFGGQYYEQPRSSVARTNRALRRARARRERRGGTLSDLGLSPRDWVKDAQQVGDDEVAGVETEHVSGILDVRRLFSDLNKLLERSSGALPGGSGSVPKLSQKELDNLADVVEDPSFDVYVGKEDDVIRRVSVDLRLTVPEKDRKELGGIEGGSLRFTVELSDVNGDQKVEAPARSRPVSALTTQLGGAAGSGSQGRSSNGGSGQQQQLPDDPADIGIDNSATVPDSTAPPEESNPNSGSIEESKRAFQRYADCLDKTKPDDADARVRCAELLR